MYQIKRNYCFFPTNLWQMNVFIDEILFYSIQWPLDNRQVCRSLLLIQFKNSILTNVQFDQLHFVAKQREKQCSCSTNVLINIFLMNERSNHIHRKKVLVFTRGNWMEHYKLGWHHIIKIEKGISHLNLKLLLWLLSNTQCQSKSQSSCLSCPNA